MCEINPKHSAFFKLEAFTSVNMTEQEFQNLVIDKLLKIEMQLNKDARFRFHIHHAE